MIFKTMVKSFIVNLILACLKIVASVLTNSKVLFADAIHGLSDMATDIIGLAGAKLASKNPDETHPYGHGKIEYVTSIFISIFIIILGIVIFKNSFGVKEIKYSLYTFIFIVLSIIIKYMLSSFLIKNGKKLGSNILITNGIESRFDIYSTSFALIMLIISRLNISFLKCTDMIGSIIISLFTVKVGLQLFFENVKSVIGEIDLDPIKASVIKKIIMENKKIKDVKNITLLKFGSYINLTAEIALNKNTKLMKISKIEAVIKKNIKEKFENIKYITISVIPSDE